MKQHAGSNSERLLQAEEKNIIYCASQSQLGSAPKRRQRRGRKKKKGVDLGERIEAEHGGRVLRENMIKKVVNKA